MDKYLPPTPPPDIELDPDKRLLYGLTLICGILWAMLVFVLYRVFHSNSNLSVVAVGVAAVLYRFWDDIAAALASV